MFLKRSSLFLFFLILSIVAACGSKKEVSDVSEKQPLRTESELSLSNTTIEEADDSGKIIWKIQAKQAKYSPDRKIAKLEGIKGDLFENGKVVLQVTATEGEVEKDAAKIILKKNVKAIDPRNRTEIKSDRAEWYPEKNLLVVPEKLTGVRNDLSVMAQRGTYATESQQLQLSEKIVATKKEPSLQLKTESLLWEIPQQYLISDRPVTISHYQNNKLVDRLTGNRANVSLQDNLATLEDNIILNSVRPDLQITTSKVTWNYATRLVKAGRKIQIDDRAKQITLIGENGSVDLAKSIATLRDGTQAVDRLQASQLYANSLIWYFDRDTVEAIGNIKYRQERPKMTLVGDRAAGNLQNNQVQITSQQGKQVETKIVIDD